MFVLLDVVDSMEMGWVCSGLVLCCYVMLVNVVYMGCALLLQGSSILLFYLPEKKNLLIDFFF